MRAVVVLRDQVWWQQEMVALGSLLEATPAFGALQHWRCTMEWGEAGWRGALGSAGALSRAAEARSWARVWLAELRTASVAEERLARRVARAAVGRRQAAMRVQAVWRGTAVRRAAEQVVEDDRDEEEREACEEARSQLSSAARRAGYRLAGRFQVWETIEAQLARERAARAEAWVMRKGATLETAAEARRAGARAAKGLRQSLMKVAERHADGEVVRRRRLVHEKAEANLQAARRRWQRDQAAGGLEGWGMGDGVSDEERRWYAFRHDATEGRSAAGCLRWERTLVAVAEVSRLRRRGGQQDGYAREDTTGAATTGVRWSLYKARKRGQRAVCVETAQKPNSVATRLWLWAAVQQRPNRRIGGAAS